MRAREAHIVIGGTYELPSRNLVVIDADVGGGALVCRYVGPGAALSPAAAAFKPVQPGREPGDAVWLTERFIAKHARGPKR